MKASNTAHGTQAQPNGRPQRSHPQPDKGAILEALAVMFDPADVIELRAFHKGKKRTDAGYFDGEHWAVLADAAVRLNRSGAAVYVTLNRIDRQLLGRYCNRIKEFASTTTSDHDVTRRRWILLDFDPVRPKDTSATDEQLEAARTTSQACLDYLRSQGWPQPMQAESGNGMHLLYRLDLPNDEGSRDLVKGALAGLAARFDDAAVSIDQTVFNAARIVKLYGTVANKGDHAPLTPWRLAHIEATPPCGELVAAGQLRALCLTTQHNDRPARVNGAGHFVSRERGPFDMADFLSRHGIEYTQDAHDGSERYRLAQCPFNPDHVNGQAALFVSADGVPGFKCQHNSCADKHWRDVRDLFDGPKPVWTNGANGTPRIRQKQHPNGADDSTYDGTAGYDESDAVADNIESDQQTIVRLASLNPLQYDRVRRAEAKRLHVQVSTLDKLVAAARTDDDESAARGPFEDVQPWSEPVDGAALLNDLVRLVRDFIICDEATAHGCALWIAMTWLMDSVDVAPIAAITAPEKRCGKSQLLFLIGRLASRPLAASNITPAALFRAIELWRPTLLIDEADSFMRENEELRGLLNCGHTRDSAYVVRTVGDDFTPKQFCTWGAKAIASIGHLADTLTDRSVPLKLRRKLPHERVGKIRHADPHTFDQLRAKLARWADDNAVEVQAARPALPEALHDRAADNWEPLLQIAEVAGGAWPDLAREAALKLSGDVEESPSTGVALLADIKTVFDKRKVSRISMADLLADLLADEEAPWRTWNRGREMTTRQLGKKLADYGIKSKPVKIGYVSPKGFMVDQFSDAFARYLFSLPVPPSPSVTRSPPNIGEGFEVTEARLVDPSENPSVTMKPLSDKAGDPVTDEKGVPGRKGNIDGQGEDETWGSV